MVYLDRVLFSLASCAISHADKITPTGQPYNLATLLPFAANILWFLWSQSAQIEGEVIEEIGEGEEDKDI
jgi:hypothetical protein